MREDGGRFTRGAISLAVIATFMIVFIRTPLPDGRVCFTITICNEDAGVRLILAQVPFPSAVATLKRLHG